ncbi:MAG TPA: hypothetical protein VF298_02455 [Bacteroidales bacterium]
MKAFLTILITATLQSIFAIGNVSAQTIAIGHVTAEVVESVSASSMAITGFDLKNESNQTASSHSALVGWKYENVNLGDIKINSGSGITCNIVMIPATLSDNYGNGFTIEPSVISSVHTITAQAPSGA